MTEELSMLRRQREKKIQRDVAKFSDRDYAARSTSLRQGEIMRRGQVRTVQVYE